jgi:ribosomal-protein-alanine N-acetyltransferase
MRAKSSTGLAEDGAQPERRVFIRAPVLGDCEEFLALVGASTRLHRGWASPPNRPEAFSEYVRRCQERDFEGFLVCRAEDERIVGSFNLSQIFYGNFQSAYMGYFVGEPFARRGYMTEAMRLVLREAFGRLRLHRVEANIQPANVASIALVERAGFVREGFSRRYLKIAGRWRDHERWAILAEDWRARVKGKTEG